MAQATALTSELKPTAATPGWTHLVTSPLVRCRAFAEHLATQTGRQLRVAEDWQEIDYGTWDGMPLSEWRKLAGPQFKAFREDASKLHPPDGEAFLTFADRVLAAWREVTELPNGSHVLIVTHGGVLRVVLPTVLGMPLNRSYPLHIPFASFSRIELRVDGEVTEKNAGEKQAAASLLFHNAAEYERS